MLTVVAAMVPGQRYRVTHRGYGVVVGRLVSREPAGLWLVLRVEECDEDRTDRRSGEALGMNGAMVTAVAAC